MINQGEKGCGVKHEYSVIFLCENAWSLSLCGERDNACGVPNIFFREDYSNIRWSLMEERVCDERVSELVRNWSEREQPRFFSRPKGKASPELWETGTNCETNLPETTKWQKCHLLVNEILKNFILIDIFSRISVFQPKDKKAKTNRVSFVASPGKAKGATSVSAQL